MTDLKNPAPSQTPDITEFPYIPCPEDPIQRIEDVEFNVANLSAQLKVIREFLERYLPLLQILEEAKAEHDRIESEENQKQAQAIKEFFND